MQILRKRGLWIGSMAFAAAVLISAGLRWGHSATSAEDRLPLETPPAEASSQPLDDRVKASIRLANDSRYADAIAALDTIPAADPAAGQAQLLRQTWSIQMLDRAVEKYSQADLKTAIAIASAVPQNTEIGDEAQRQIRLWQRQQQIIDEALKLIETDPQRALNRFRVFENAPFAQSNRYKKWIAQAQAQIRWRRYSYY